MIKTLKFRVKDSASTWLDNLAKDVNFVWNYINDLSFKMIKNKNVFLSTYDIHPYLVGSTKGEYGLNIHAATIQAISNRYVINRKIAKKRKLKWRVSHGSRKSLGWIPFKPNDIKVKNGYFWYGKNKFKIWDSYGIDKYILRSGSFNQDSQGHWYINVCVDVEDHPSKGTGEVGIDLGLKDFAVMSDGEKIEAHQFYRSLESKLAMSQRANKKKQTKAIHRKITNKRKDFLHKLSTRLVDENKLIVVGSVNSSGLAKTNMAKSVLDAGWSMFRTMLEYKAIRRQVEFKVVNEAWTSQACSGCNDRTGPKGLVGLGIREWTCSSCGSVHDRDVNAAKNILRLGHQSPVVGIPYL